MVKNVALIPLLFAFLILWSAFATPATAQTPTPTPPPPTEWLVHHLVWSAPPYPPFLAQNKTDYFTMDDGLNVLRVRNESGNFIEHAVYLNPGEYVFRSLSLHPHTTGFQFAASLLDADNVNVCGTNRFQLTLDSSTTTRGYYWTRLDGSSGITTCVVNTAGTYKLRFSNASVTVAGESRRWHLREFKILLLSDTDPNPPPPPPPATWGSTSCTLVIDTTSGNVITATQTLTNTPTLTNTSVITVPANLINNGTLETPSAAGNTPAHWQWDRPIYAAGQWRLDGTNRVIAAAATPEPTLLIRQTITQTLPNATYMYGLDSAYSNGPAAVLVRFGFTPAGSGGGGGGVSPMMLFDTTPEDFSYSPTLTNTWQTLTGTLSTSGNRYLSVAFPENDGTNQLAIDNLFVVPVESDGNGGWRVRCATIGELYTATTTTPTTPTVPIAPVPPAAGVESLAGSLGGTCYDCISPKTGLDLGQLVVWLSSLTDRGTYIHMFQLAIAAIAHWSIYLACIITNLVKCHLYAWIFSIQNATMWLGGVGVNGVNGVMTGLNTGLNWVATGAQGTLNWGAGVYLGGRDLLGMALAWLGGVFSNALIGFNYLAVQIGNILNPGNALNLLLSVGEVVLALIEFLVRPFLVLVNIAITIAETVWDVAAAVVNALTASPESIDEWANSPEANINSDMIIVLLWILGTVDRSLATYHMIPAVYMIVGGMGLMAFKKWSEKWESILPI